jgi:hypothetical protein
LVNEIFAGVMMRSLHGDENRNDLLRFIACAWNRQKAEVQLLTLYSGALFLQLCDAAFER